MQTSNRRAVRRIIDRIRTGIGGIEVDQTSDRRAGPNGRADRRLDPARDDAHGLGEILLARETDRLPSACRRDQGAAEWPNRRGLPHASDHLGPPVFVDRAKNRRAPESRPVKQDLQDAFDEFSLITRFADRPRSIHE